MIPPSDHFVPYMLGLVLGFVAGTGTRKSFNIDWLFAGVLVGAILAGGALSWIG